MDQSLVLIVILFSVICSYSSAESGNDADNQTWSDVKEDLTETMSMMRMLNDKMDIFRRRLEGILPVHF